MKRLDAIQFRFRLNPSRRALCRVLATFNPRHLRAGVAGLLQDIRRTTLRTLSTGCRVKGRMQHETSREPKSRSVHAHPNARAGSRQPGVHGLQTRNWPRTFTKRCLQGRIRYVRAAAAACDAPLALYSTAPRIINADFRPRRRMPNQAAFLCVQDSDMHMESSLFDPNLARTNAGRAFALDSWAAAPHVTLYGPGLSASVGQDSMWADAKTRLKSLALAAMRKRSSTPPARCYPLVTPGLHADFRATKQSNK